MKKPSQTQSGPKVASADTGRPRNAQATEAILRAALALGLEGGFQGVTIEGIAERAGVGKTTIYRRWPDVWTVVVEAVMTEITQVSPVLERTTRARELPRVDEAGRQGVSRQDR